MEKEIWKIHENFDKYEISNWGKIKQIKNDLILKEILHDGYHRRLLVNSEGKRVNIRIHRLVADLFVFNDNPSIKNFINHKDGNKSNNYYQNLEWVTIKENNHHALINKLRPLTLSNNDIREIRRLFHFTDIPIKEITQKFNSTNQNILKIAFYESYFLVDPNKRNDYPLMNLSEDELSEILTKRHYNIKNNKSIDLTDEVKSEICNKYNNGTKKYELMFDYNLSFPFLNKILENPPTKIIPLKDEYFKVVFNNIQVSNLGRIFINNKLEKKSIITFNGIDYKRIYLMGLAFLEPNSYSLNKVILIDQEKPLSAINIKWLFDPQLENKIIDDYVNNELTKTEIMTKYNVSRKIVKPILKDYNYLDNLRTSKRTLKRNEEYRKMKPNCQHCGDTNEANFTENRKKTCKKCQYQNRLNMKKPPHCKNCNETNPEHFYNHNRSRCKKCQSKINKLKYINKSSSDKETYINKGKKWREDNMIRVRLQGAKYRALKNNFEFNIDENFILDLLQKQNNRCKYSNILLDLNIMGSDKNFLNNRSLSIDRIDSNKGYTKDNVVLVASIINFMKRELNYDEFLSIIKEIYVTNFPEKDSQLQKA